MTPALTRMGSRFATLLRASAKRLVVAAGIVSVAAASVTVTARESVPPAWLQFAALTSTQFESWLAQEDSSNVQRLHAGLAHRNASSPAGRGNRLVVRVWVAGDGRVTQVRFSTLGNAQLDQDLRAILTAQPLPATPPPDMPQPMVLQLSLDLKT